MSCCFLRPQPCECVAQSAVTSLMCFDAVSQTPLLFLSVPPSPSSRGGPEDEMSTMLNSIKEGGVSLIGHEQPFTHDHFRKSFIRRNKNPVINEKIHTLRALQSTLKVSRGGPPARGSVQTQAMWWWNRSNMFSLVFGINRHIQMI